MVRAFDTKMGMGSMVAWGASGMDRWRKAELVEGASASGRVGSQAD